MSRPPLRRPTNPNPAALPTPAEIKRLGAAATLHKVNEALNDLGTDYRRKLVNRLAATYAVAFVLRADVDEWQQFCLAKEWDSFRGRPREKHRDDALRFALRFAVGFFENPMRQKAAARRASKFHRALGPLFEDGVSPRDVPVKIRDAGGIAKLAETNGGARVDTKGAREAEVLLRLPLRTAQALLRYEADTHLQIQMRLTGVKNKTLRAEIRHWRVIEEAPIWIPIGPCNTENARDGLKPRQLPRPMPMRIRSTAPRPTKPR